MTLIPDKDHPRSRGVYMFYAIRFPNVVGSSPLARGLRARRMGGLDALRIIPARAGFTLHHHEIISASRDHPRSRGVYRRRSSLILEIAGSSPLARGLRVSIISSLLTAGIIPARAGFTKTELAWRRSQTDHPRSRGVYAISSPGPASTQGSSPLARGLPQTIPKLTDRTGIIPARAGFTNSDPRSTWCV